jgi:hypothetical protein
MSALLQNALTPHGHAAQYALLGLDVVQFAPYHPPTLGVYVSPQPIPPNSLENIISLLGTHHVWHHTGP